MQNNPVGILSQSIIQLKGSMMSVVVLKLYSTQFTAITHAIQQKIALSPKLFHQMPLIVDCEELANDTLEQNFFTALHQWLRKKGILPIGVRNLNPACAESALTAGFTLLSNSKAQNNALSQADKWQASKMLQSPVRAGQQIYAEKADLIVCATVNEGAEVIADGNIHVYGNLRGRALAGMNQKMDAKIFCQQFNAQLVSIAGHYLTCEHIEKKYIGRAVCIELLAATLSFSLLN